jgi:hypothetical protein
MGSSFNEVIEGWVGIACEKFFCVLMVQNSFVLSMWVHGAFLVDVQRACCHIKQLVHSTPKGI